MKIERVSQKEMKRRTGMNALGYTFPEKETILLQEGLPRTKEKEVLAHEHEHYQKGEEGPFWGAVISAVGGALAASKQKKAAAQAAAQQQAAADKAAEQAAFNPYNISGGAFGNVAFNRDDGTAQFNLNPQMQALSDLFGQQAGQFSGQGQTELGALAAQGGLDFLTQGIQADPFATAQTQFDRMEEILAPARDRQREALESRLLRQGRLGSTGGALQQESLESSIEDSRRKGLVEALGQGMGIQGQQLAQGQQLGIFGQQQQDVGFNQALARLGGMQSIEQQLMNMANLGSSLGGRQSAAGAQQGAFGMQGATSGTAALLGGAAGQADAYGKLGSALGNINWGDSTTAYNPNTGGGTLAAKTDDQWANNWDY